MRLPSRRGHQVALPPSPSGAAADVGAEAAADLAGQQRWDAPGVPLLQAKPDLTGPSQPNMLSRPGTGGSRQPLLLPSLLLRWGLSGYRCH